MWQENTRGKCDVAGITRGKHNVAGNIRKKPDEYIVRCSQCSTSRSIDCPLIYRTTVVTHLTYIVL